MLSGLKSKAKPAPSARLESSVGQRTHVAAYGTLQVIIVSGSDLQVGIETRIRAKLGRPLPSVLLFRTGCRCEREQRPVCRHHFGRKEGENGR